MACAPSEDSDQPGHPLSLISFRCEPRTQCFFRQTAKTLIRPCGWRCRSESSLGVHVILLVLSCCGSFTVGLRDIAIPNRYYAYHIFHTGLPPYNAKADRGRRSGFWTCSDRVGREQVIGVSISHHSATTTTTIWRQPRHEKTCLRGFRPG